MNIFSTTSLLTSVLSFALALFVIKQRENVTINTIWARTSIAIAFWSLGLFGVTYFNDYDVAYASQIILDIAAIFVPAFFLNFVIVLLEKDKQLGRLIKLSYLLSGILSLLSFTKLFKKGLVDIFEFEYWIDPGPLYWSFPISFMIIAAISVYLLIRHRDDFSGVKKQQVKYVLYSAFIGFGGGFFNFLPQFSSIYPIGNYLVGFYTIIITYAIVKFRLLNIRLAITKSILYAGLVASVSAFFALSIFVASTFLGLTSSSHKLLIYVIDSFLIVIFLDPIKTFLAKITDKIFYKDKVNYQDILQQAGNIIAKELDLRILSEKLSVLLTNKLKIKQVDIFDSNFNKLAFSGHKNISIDEDVKGFLSGHTETIVVEELIREIGNLKNDDKNYKAINDIIDKLQSLDIEMIVPIVDVDRQIAYLLISEKYSGDLFNEDDINFFQVLVPQIASAVEKSQLYEEVQKFNIKLQRQVDQRTKSLQEANKALEDRNKFLTTMQVVSNMLSRTMNLKKVTQMIADSIAIELGYVGGILSFVDDERKHLKVDAITETKETKVILQTLPQDPKTYVAELKSGYSLGVDTVLTGQIIYSDSLSKFLCPPADEEVIGVVQEALGIKTVVGVPIFSEDKVIGIIHFLLPFEENKISSLDVETMTAMTNQVGILSRNLQLYDNLQSTNKELQEANVHLRALDKAKSEFVSIASHQLRTPISAIKGYLSMLLEGDFGKLDPAVKKVISGIFESSSRLARLVNIFLNVSRIESGRLKLDIKPLQINDLINSVIMELANEAKQKGLELTYGQAEEKLPLVAADTDKLREVILNLIDNSIKYTPEGSVNVSVDVESDKLTFIVKDTGIGIDPEEAKGLFRKFVRGSGVSQIHTGGSGLGLFIAQRIINEHQGKIWAESEGKGKGSAFKFEIPLYKEN